MRSQENPKLAAVDGLSSLAPSAVKVTVTGNGLVERVALPLARSFGSLVVTDEPSVVSIDLPEALDADQVTVLGCAALSAVRAPRLARVGELAFGPGEGAPLADLAFPALREVQCSMSVRAGVRTLAPSSAMDRVGSNLELASPALPAAEVDAFVRQLTSCRGVGGQVVRGDKAP